MFKKNQILIYLFAVGLLCIATSCKRDTHRYTEYFFQGNSNDLSSILHEKKLKVLIEKSPTSYFEYKGVKMGFEYEILKEFAKSLNVVIEPVFINNLDNVEKQLIQGDASILACSYTVTKDRRELLDFSTPILRTPQVLIQRFPNDSTPQYIKDPIQLIRKKITVWKTSSSFYRVKSLEQEIGDSIYIQAIDGYKRPDELIADVATKKIDYTIVDNHIAVANSFLYTNLDHHLRLSIKQQIAFGLRKDTPNLKYTLNKWLRRFKNTPEFRFLKQKYFHGKELSELTYQDYINLGGGKLSAYDKMFKKEARKYDMEWHLIAAIVQQESNFRPYVKGKGGAFGLMQFMPKTGKRYGVHPESSPSTQIKAGMKKIHSDFVLWKKIPNSTQRIKFALATYNAGYSMVERAQKNAEQEGLNPLLWDDNVELSMKKIGKKGRRATLYASQVFKRYLSLKRLFE